ncbi:MAG: hypothetical protein NTY02_00265 [Acidobacteria bacterium]|nr:hypothetical protein [Acidobacteriota bacterium]
MASSFALYGFALLAVVGLVSFIRPLRCLQIRRRWIGLLLVFVCASAGWAILEAPALANYVTTPVTTLDRFVPIYQFRESFSIPVHASPSRVYEAIFQVSADEVPFYRTLAWIRRGAASGAESVLNPPDRVPLVTVATRTSFLRLGETRGREFVMGTVVIAPPGVRLAVGSDPESFRLLDQEGFAKAAISFRVEPMDRGWCRLRTETRVYATDPDSRDRFARYWRVIAPGSALTRMMWLRAIKVRAESPAR